MEPTATAGTGTFEVTGEAPQQATQEPRGMDRLRERVEAAAVEIERLRAENAALRAGAQPAVPTRAGANTLSLFPEADGAETRKRLDGFIAAIDDALRTSDGHTGAN